MTFLKALGLSLQICGFMALAICVVVAITALLHHLFGPVALLFMVFVVIILSVAGFIYEDSN